MTAVLMCPFRTFDVMKMSKQFPDNNLKNFSPSNLKLGAGTLLTSGKTPIDFEAAILDFKVTDCKKVKTVSGQ